MGRIVEPVKQKDYVTVKEFQDLTGRSDNYVYTKLKLGEIKKWKEENEGKIIHKSEVEKHKYTGPGRQRMVNIVPPSLKLNGPDDFDLSKLDNFIVEKGKHSFKAYVQAVDMTFQRKPWSEIFQETGVKQIAVIKLLTELKEARAKEPKRFLTLMDYLNAGRPYNYKNRDMTKKR